MAEAKGDIKVEGKVSSRAMEAAMVARLFKDAMESSTPIVSHFVWERDDGQSLDMSVPKVHPSFPNPEIACRRLELRISQWVSGDKPGLDKNALARLEVKGASSFDLSLESFEKAALSDDGQLVIAVGLSKGVGREPMELNKNIRLKLYAKDGTLIGRRQALLPIKEIINIQKKEREAQAKRLASQELDFESDDIGRELSKEEGRQWAELNAEPSKVFAEPVLKHKKSNADDGVEQAKKMMDIALQAVNKNMGEQLKNAPLPVAEAKTKTQQSQQERQPLWEDPRAQKLWNERVEELEAHASEMFSTKVAQIEQSFELEVDARVARKIKSASTSSAAMSGQGLEDKARKIAEEELLKFKSETEALAEEKWQKFSQVLIADSKKGMEDQQRADRHALEQSHAEQQSLQRRLVSLEQEAKEWAIKYEKSEVEWLDEASLQKDEFDKDVLVLSKKFREVEAQKQHLEEDFALVKKQLDLAEVAKIIISETSSGDSELLAQASEPLDHVHASQKVEIEKLLAELAQAKSSESELVAGLRGQLDQAQRSQGVEQSLREELEHAKSVDSKAVASLKGKLELANSEISRAQEALASELRAAKDAFEKSEEEWVGKIEEFRRKESHATPASSPSIVRTEKPSIKMDVELIKAVFPNLPEGFDEILISVEKDQLFEALEALEAYGTFEARLASKGAQLTFGLAVPAGKVAILSDFINQFSKGGVMIKRNPPKQSGEGVATA